MSLHESANFIRKLKTFRMSVETDKTVLASDFLVRNGTLKSEGECTYVTRREGKA